MENTINTLFQKYLDGNCNPDEIKTLLAHFKSNAHEKTLKRLIVAELQVQNETAAPPDLDQRLDNIYGQLKDHIDQGTNQPQDDQASHDIRTLPLWRRIAVAASVFLAISAGGYFFLHRPTIPAQQVLQIQGEEQTPNTNGIVLTLGNGHQVTINAKHNGQIPTTDGTKANQHLDQLAYGPKANASSEPAVIHTLTNNSGNKFSLTLADGTEANLDAASTITYPTVFNGNERKVAVTGQVYFKVAHKASQPFFVSTKNQTIEDIGTEFNINAYADENIITTLVAGKVAVKTGSNRKTLEPGQQAEVDNSNNLHTDRADIEAATAWLQGKLVFHHEPLESIMKSIARIYDVNVIWVDESAKAIKVNGSVNRTKQLATVLNFFRKTGEVDFQVTGKTIKVFKKK